MNIPNKMTAEEAVKIIQSGDRVMIQGGSATPQALILGDLYGPMQPRYCSIVPPGTEYVGINDIAAQQATAGSHIC